MAIHEVWPERVASEIRPDKRRAKTRLAESSLAGAGMEKPRRAIEDYSTVLLAALTPRLRRRSGYRYRAKFQGSPALELHVEQLQGIERRSSPGSKYRRDLRF